MPFREIKGNYRLGEASDFIGKAGSLAVDTSTSNVFVQNEVTTGALISNSNTSSAFLKTVVTLSPSDIETINTNPPIIVPAPGVGKSIIIFESIYSYNFGTTAYSGSYNAGSLYYGSLAVQADNFDANILTLPASACYKSLPYSWSGNAYTSSTIDNMPLIFGTTFDTLSGGDGTLDITVLYFIIDVI